MGFDDGKIVLNSDTGTYLAGETLHGKLLFRQDKVKTFRGIYVELKGYAHVNWTTRHSRKVNDRLEYYNVNHNADEEYFRGKQYLVGSSKDEYHLKTGDHTFPFQYHIPSNCPSSYEGSYGFVKYKIKVVVDRAMKLDQEKELEFQVKCPVDLDAISNCKHPLELSFEDTYCSWCVAAGCCETVVKLPRSGFCVGETVPVELSCANQSRVAIDEVKLQIVKTTTFHAHSQPGTKSEEEKIVELSKGSIPGGTTRHWLLDLKIPLMDPCNLDGCRIIDVDYRFKVKVKTSGCHVNSEQYETIIIGDGPLNVTNNSDRGEDSTSQSFSSKSQNISPVAYPMANNVNPQPQVPALYPGANPTYPGGNLPYPGAYTSYPGGNLPYPGANPSYPGSNPFYPGGNSPYPGANPSYPGGNSPYPGGNTPYPPGSISSPNVPYTGMPATSPNFGTQGLTTPYPGPTVTDPAKSPALGFRIPEANPATVPLMAYSTGPTPVNPYASASAPAIGPEPSNDTSESQATPYNPEFMK